MRKTIIITATVMFLMAIILQAHAVGSDWKLDPAHSGIYFEIDHIYAVTRGYSEKFDSKVIFDRNGYTLMSHL